MRSPKVETGRVLSGFTAALAAANPSPPIQSRRDASYFDASRIGFDPTPHRVAFTVLATSCFSAERIIDFVYKEHSRLPAHYTVTPILMAAVNGDSLSGLEAHDLEVISEAGNASDALFAMRNRAYNHFAATIQCVISDQVTYHPSDLVNNIRSLFYYRAPTVLTSHTPGRGFFDPVDLTFYTDAHYVREQHRGLSFLDQIRPYLLANTDPRNPDRVEVMTMPRVWTEADYWKPAVSDTYELLSPADPQPLPRSGKIVAFEPHPDDLVLAASSLLKRLLENQNTVEVVGIFKEGEQDGFWPVLEPHRTQENTKAFQILNEAVSKRQSSTASIRYIPLHVEAAYNSVANELWALASATRTLKNYFQAALPDVIVLPAAEDTHRHHVRMREAILRAATAYVISTGRRLRVFAVPLYSAEAVAYEGLMHFVLPTTVDLADQRQALNAFVSQEQYTGIEQFAHWSERRQEMLAGHAGVRLEGYSERILSTERSVEKHAAFQLAALGPNALRLGKLGDQLVCELVSTPGGVRVQLFSETPGGREPAGITALEQGLEDLYDAVLARDHTLGRRTQPTVSVGVRPQDPLVWLVAELNAYAGLDQIPKRETAHIVLALQILYERIAGYIEDLKLEHGLLDRHPQRDPALLQRHRQEPQHLVIGIPSHQSQQIIAQKLRDLAAQIRDFPPEWSNWPIEVVLSINAKPQDLDALANATLRQIPHDVFASIENPVQLVALKSPYANASVATNAIYKYAQAQQASLVLMTDDDVRFDRQALVRMIEALFSYPEKCVIGTTFYWRPRPLEQHLKQDLQWMQTFPLVRSLPILIQTTFCRVLLPLRVLWDEIAIFRRRADIPFSPRELMGAASLRWADDYRRLPYWITQLDIWERYRYAPRIVIPQEARSSSLAAQSLAYYVAKRARTYYGYSDIINHIFSESRRRVQDDGDVYYLQHFMRIGLRNVSVRDLVLLSLSQALFHGTNVLYRVGRFYFRRPQFIWSTAERGALPAPVTAREALLPEGLFARIGARWNRLVIQAQTLAVEWTGGPIWHIPYREVNDVGAALVREPAEPAFESRFRDIMSHISVNAEGFPEVSQSQLCELVDAYRDREPSTQCHNADYLREAMRIALVLYAVPDVQSREILRRFDLRVSQLRSYYGFIRGSDVMQSLFDHHPGHHEFFLRMKGLLTYPRRLSEILRKTSPYPMDVEIHPSTTCNIRCEFCYSKDQMFYPESRSHEEPLTQSQWLAFIDEMAANGVRRMDISGGLEPLTSKAKTLAIINHAKERGLDVRLFTNGIVINPRDRALMETLIRMDRISVSVRGATARTFAVTTGTAEVTYRKLMEGIKALVTYRAQMYSPIHIGLAFLVSQSDHREIAEMVELAHQLGVDSIALSTENTVHDLAFDAAQRRVILDSLRRVQAKLAQGDYGALTLILNPALMALTAVPHEHAAVFRYRLRTPRNGQMIWSIRPVINPYGKIFPCAAQASPEKNNAQALASLKALPCFGKIMESKRPRLPAPHRCEFCNPNERYNLACINRLLEDEKCNVYFFEQPYRAHYPFGSRPIRGGWGRFEQVIYRIHGYL